MKHFEFGTCGAESVLNAEERTERPSDTNRARNTDGSSIPQLLDSGSSPGRVACKRLRAGAREAPFRATHCVSRQHGPAGSDRRVLPASRRLALVRTQRGSWTALSLSRLEV